MIRRPGLLAADLSETARLEPTAASLTLKMIGAGEAALTLAEDAPTVHVHDWVSMYTGQGLAGIFRVTNVAQTYRRQIEVSLLHGIDILSDSVWAAQTTFTGTKAAFLAELLNQQTQLINGVKPWQLGRCEDSGSIERDINYDRLSTLLEALEVEGSNYYFVYDQTTWPWTIHYVAKTNAVSSECRLTRNIRTATVTYNDADLCTRLYLSVSSKNEDTVTVKKANPNYISDEATPGVPALVDTNITVSSTDSAVRTYDNTAAQAIWGIVVKTADIDTHDDIQEQHFPSADAWAANYLALRAEPSVQIQIDGDTLRELTGNEWDESDIGALCQVALPEYGHTFREYVVTVTYPDLVRDESHVTISLANTLPKVSESIAMARSEAKTAARASRATARTAADAKEVTSWSQIVQYHAEALDGSGVLTLYESGISMDATGGVKIYSLSEGLQGLYSEVKVNADEIYAESQKINLVIKDGAIDAGSIVGAINDQKESIVVINADRVNIDGKKSVKISDALFIADGGAFWVKRNATFGETAGHLVTINNGTVNAPTIQVNSGGSLTFSPSTQQDSALSLTRATVAGLVTDVQISGPVNNVYTLQYKKIGTGNTWNNASVTFSRATTLYKSNYTIDGTAKTAGWSSGTFTVRAEPQNESISTRINDIVLVSSHQDSTIKKQMDVTLKVMYDNEQDDDEDGETGFTKANMGIDATPIYTYGNRVVGLNKSYTSANYIPTTAAQHPGTFLVQTSGRLNAAGTAADEDTDYLPVNVSTLMVAKSSSMSGTDQINGKTYKGTYSFSRSSGGVVSIAGIATKTASAAGEIALELSAPYATPFTWNETGHENKYSYTVKSGLKADGSNVLSYETNTLELNPTEAINYGKTLVTVSSATLSNIVANSSTRSATATLTVTLDNGDTKSLTGVDVSEIYQAGLDGTGPITSRSFDFRLVDNSGAFVRTRQKSVDVSDVYQKGVDDATPAVTYVYVYASGNNGAVNMRSSPSGSTGNLIGRLYCNTKVTYISYSNGYAKVSYDGYTGYISCSGGLDHNYVWTTPKSGVSVVTTGWSQAPGEGGDDPVPSGKTFDHYEATASIHHANVYSGRPTIQVQMYDSSDHVPITSNPVSASSWSNYYSQADQNPKAIYDVYHTNYANNLPVIIQYRVWYRDNATSQLSYEVKYGYVVSEAF